ncbi:MAG: capsular polysaccharide biosynthesis protein CapF [Paludibacter sp.]|nr:capsular polysaccharide biosynthesis protein CapF [Paludibacter sp.]
MKLLITGSMGFIGRNLIAELHNRGYNDLFLYDTDTNPALLDDYTRECDFVFHLAGVNRPDDPKEFMEGNFGFTSVLLDSLKKQGNKAPVLITSSTQAALDNPYGRSKLAGEELMRSYAKETNAPVFIFRLPNVFGKWCRPNYNSAVATFCNNIANGLPIQVNDPSVGMKLVYVDDVVNAFIERLSSAAKQQSADELEEIAPVYSVELGKIVELIYSFRESRTSLQLPDMGDEFTKKLYSTYLSYLPTDQFSYPLTMNTDDRGSFTEFLKSPDRGQVSVNISRPGITKGNHWHHTKNEKFLVVSGRGVIRFRKIDSDEVIEYFVSGDQLEVVDIPVGYTHNIENLGETDMVTVMWVNEVFNREKPDTFFVKV